MKKLNKFLYVIPLIIISTVSIVPFYFIISMATHTTSEIYRTEIFLPGSVLIDNFTTIISGGFLKYYWNSFYTSLISAIFSLFVTLMASYGLSIYKFKSRDFVTRVIVASMMIPAQIGLLGYTVEMKNLGLMNTHWPLIFTWLASAYGVYFVSQFIKTSLPKELIESARIDGSGEFNTFIKIGIPMVKPAIGTQFMLIFLWSWNNFMMPSIVLTNSKKFTIPLGIQTLATAYTQNWGARGAALALSVIPMLIIFAFGSKYFIKGLASGAVKG
ncbi:MAG: carbohydrate ABC transporter permease [Bacilli bacterium]